MKAHRSTAGTGSLLVTALLGFAACCAGVAAENEVRPLTTAAAVRNLSTTEAAQKHPVKLRGVVTFHDEALYSRFVQDETAGIYLLEMTNMPALLPGQVVEVEGVTGPGEFAPVVQPTSVKVVGEGKLPAAKAVTLEELVSGLDDSQMVEFSGTVRAVRFERDSQYHTLDFAKGGERFTVYAKQLPVAEAQDLVASTVKVRGVCATMFNHQRQLFGIRLLVPKADGLVVEKAAPANPFSQPAHKLNSLLQFAPAGTFDGRVKVAGTVTYFEPGNALFLQDENAGLYCQTSQRDGVQPGDQVEILGFPAKGEYTPVLVDAVYRKAGAGTVPKAVAVDVNAILTGVHDCKLVQLPARVLGVVQRGLNRFLLLEAGDFTFQAYLPQKADGAELAELPAGSEVLATGICMIQRGNKWQAGDKWRAASFHLLLRSPDDVVVLKSPSAATAANELWLPVGLGMVALGSILWAGMLRRKVRHQSEIIQRIKA